MPPTVRKDAVPKKTCSECGETKPTTSFYMNTTYFRSECKQCVSVKRQAHWHAHGNDILRGRLLLGQAKDSTAILQEAIKYLLTT